MITKWSTLFIAGLFEVSWAVCMKYYHLCDPTNKIYFLSFSIVSAITAFFLLTISIKTIPISIAYSVWTGIGIIGVTLFDIFIFNEPGSFIKYLMITIILTGIIGLKFIE